MLERWRERILKAGIGVKKVAPGFKKKKLMQKSKKWLFPDVCGASPTEGKKGGITDQLGVWVLENNTDQARSQPDPFGTRVGPT